MFGGFGGPRSSNGGSMFGGFGGPRSSNGGSMFGGFGGPPPYDNAHGGFGLLRQSGPYQGVSAGNCQNSITTAGGITIVVSKGNIADQSVCYSLKLCYC
jgi:hypothetical protein